MVVDSTRSSAVRKTVESNVPDMYVYSNVHEVCLKVIVCSTRTKQYPSPFSFEVCHPSVQRHSSLS